MDSEEIANTLTHGGGLVLSLAGLVFLIVVTALHGDAVHIMSCCVYGVTLVFMYAASTIYHTIVSARWKHIFKIIDHCCIYLLIAGTYTPFTLVNLRGAWGWTLFGVIWGLALAGILLKLWFVDYFPIASTTVYIAMGWLAVIAVKPLLTAASVPEPVWLVFIVFGAPLAAERIAENLASNHTQMTCSITCVSYASYMQRFGDLQFVTRNQESCGKARNAWRSRESFACECGLGLRGPQHNSNFGESQ